MSKYILFLVFSLGIYQYSKSQNASTKNQGTQLVYMINPVQLNVNTNTEIDNFLVLISDSAGQTIFLDNRFHFTGPYIRTVDLSRSGKGPYTLCIAKDNERTFSRFFIK